MHAKQQGQLKRRRGQALVEMALVLGVLLVFFLAAVEFSYVWMVAGTLNTIAQQGARLVSSEYIPRDVGTLLPDGGRDITSCEVVRARIYDASYEAIEVEPASTEVDLDEQVFDRLPPLNRQLRQIMRYERWQEGPPTPQSRLLLRMPGALYRGNQPVGTPGRFRVFAPEISKTEMQQADPSATAVLHRIVEITRYDDRVQVYVRFPYTFLAMSGTQLHREFSAEQVILDTSHVDITGLTRWEEGIWMLGAGGAELAPGDPSRNRLKGGNQQYRIRPHRMFLRAAGVMPREVY